MASSNSEFSAAAFRLGSGDAGFFEVKGVADIGSVSRGRPFVWLVLAMTLGWSNSMAGRPVGR